MSILTKLSQPSSNLSPATQKKMIVVTNNYDMPILTEFLQLNPSQSPELKSIKKTSNSTKSLQPPHKFVKMMKVNSSPTTTTISIPNTTDDENTIDEEKSKNQLLTDSIESNLFTDVWNEENTQALRANFLKKVFGGDGGSVVVIPPLKHLLLDDVPDPPERQQPPCQLPHYYRQRQIIEIPLHSCDEKIIQYY